MTTYDNIRHQTTPDDTAKPFPTARGFRRLGSKFSEAFRSFLFAFFAFASGYLFDTVLEWQ